MSSDTSRTTERTAQQALIAEAEHQLTCPTVHNPKGLLRRFIAALRASEGGRTDDQSRSGQPQPAVAPLTHAATTETCRANHGPFVCTEPLGHAGAHIARGMHTVWDQWPNDGYGNASLSEAGSSTQSASAKDKITKSAPSVEGTETANTEVYATPREAFAAVLARAKDYGMPHLKLPIAAAEQVLDALSAVSGDQRQAETWQEVKLELASAHAALRTAELADSERINRAVEHILNALALLRLPPPSGSSAEQEKA